MAPPTGVIEQFLHPPLAVMTRELIVGLRTGSGTLTRPRGPVAVDAFGITFDFITVPAGFGSTPGNFLEWEPRMLQLSVVHTLLDGHSVISENFDLHQDAEPILWSLALPTSVLFDIAPGVEVQFFWLLAF